MTTNKRPKKWWASTPKINDNMVLCVAVSPNGDETTDWFSIDELKQHLRNFSRTEADTT
jgi:hypothetical protein